MGQKLDNRKLEEEPGFLILRVAETGRLKSTRGQGQEEWVRLTRTLGNTDLHEEERLFLFVQTPGHLVNPSISLGCKQIPTLIAWVTPPGPRNIRWTRMQETLWEYVSPLFPSSQPVYVDSFHIPGGFKANSRRNDHGYH